MPQLFWETYCSQCCFPLILMMVMFCMRCILIISPAPDDKDFMYNCTYITANVHSNLQKCNIYYHFLYRILVFCDIPVKISVLKQKVAINWYYEHVIVRLQCKNGKLITCVLGLCDTIHTSQLITRSILQN